MRLVTFSDKNQNTLRVGVLEARDGSSLIVDLVGNKLGLPTTMRSLLEHLNGDFRSLEQAVRHDPSLSRIAFEDAILGPVVPDPHKIICIGLNYRDHAHETNLTIPEVPTVFAKYGNTLIGQGAAILMSPATSEVDYEAELAFVIGRRAKQVAMSDALSYIAGYTIFNDVSARDYQLRTSQWTLGKSFDTFGPLGPALVTADEIPDPHALGIRLRVGEELLQDSNTREMIFTIATLVTHLSSAMTLEPGDVVATGTPAGVGFTRKPPRYLRPGETVEIEIEGLGKLQNPVRLAG
jgi:2-keto-4-pentenoate hydratase/2-oxohepta-3-ene-1,7-dioic acid hydratase in catechol pathway